jgi:hypothetical protein
VVVTHSVTLMQAQSTATAHFETTTTSSYSSAQLSDAVQWAGQEETLSFCQAVEFGATLS